MELSKKILIESFKKMVDAYNNKEKGINYVDIRNFEQYVLSNGITMKQLKDFVG